MSAPYYVVPIARHGFIPCDPIRNPVSWHIEDAEGKLVTAVGFRELEDAEVACKALNEREGGLE